MRIKWDHPFWNNGDGHDCGFWETSPVRGGRVRWRSPYRGGRKGILRRWGMGPQGRSPSLGSALPRDEDRDVFEPERDRTAGKSEAPGCVRSSRKRSDVFALDVPVFFPKGSRRTCGNPDVACRAADPRTRSLALSGIRPAGPVRGELFLRCDGCSLSREGVVSPGRHDFLFTAGMGKIAPPAMLPSQKLRKRRCGRIRRRLFGLPTRH